jgi:exopolysaccharide/PEP-CTERM locus tyrosine autokinase
MGKFSKALEKSPAMRNRARRPKAPGERISTSVPFSGANWDSRLKLSTDPHSRYFENFRRLRGAILHGPADRRPKTLLVTSAAPGEGKGFICANIGVALSQDVEHHALMLDCDFRRPTLAGLFGLSNDTGLADHLQDDVDLSYLIRKTGQPKLSLIPSGKPPRNPAELLSSNRMAALLEELAERYPDRLILVDSPPYTVASETTILAQHLDGVVLVIRHGVSKKEHVKKLIEAVGPGRIAGVVYNGYPQNALGEMLDKQLGYSYNYYY